MDESGQCCASTTLLVSSGKEGLDLLGVNQPPDEILEEPGAEPGSRCGERGGNAPSQKSPVRAPLDLEKKGMKLSWDTPFQTCSAETSFFLLLERSNLHVAAGLLLLLLFSFLLAYRGQHTGWGGNGIPRPPDPAIGHFQAHIGVLRDTPVMRDHNHGFALFGQR